MRKNFLLVLVILLSFMIKGLAMNYQTKSDSGKTGLQKATFAGGCFWCMQPPYDGLPGVISTTVGYTGGHKKNPSYEEVSTGKTGHAEAVHILFDPAKTSYAELLQTFWHNIEPTNVFGQFGDVGSQYRTVIFYHNEEQKQLALKSKQELEASGKFDRPIATKIKPAGEFYPAEDYHQEFYRKNPLRYNNYKIGSGRVNQKNVGEEITRTDLQLDSLKNFH